MQQKLNRSFCHLGPINQKRTMSEYIDNDAFLHVELNWFATIPIPLLANNIRPSALSIIREILKDIKRSAESMLEQIVEKIDDHKNKYNILGGKILDMSRSKE